MSKLNNGKKLTPTILFEDTHLIVLSKPAGLLSQGGPDKPNLPNLVDWLRSYLGRHYVGLIHRLDRNTSGIMLVAKRTKSAARLSQALQRGEISRTYLGWVEGRITKPPQWQHYLVKDEQKNLVSITSESSPNAKLASLKADPIAYGTWQGIDLTLLEFNLDTGRSHQIRVQCAHEGLPLLGDTKYGSGKTTDFGRPALHSYRLSFRHPVLKNIMAFCAEPPADMKTPSLKISRP
ncbi:MAG: RluA family pseudouridine synthase [Bdellovibrionota bacterium]